MGFNFHVQRVIKSGKKCILNIAVDLWLLTLIEHNELSILEAIVSHKYALMMNGDGQLGS